MSPSTNTRFKINHFVVFIVLDNLNKSKPSHTPISSINTSVVHCHHKEHRPHDTKRKQTSPLSNCTRRKQRRFNARTIGFPVLRSGKRDWQYRGRPGTQQYAYPSVNVYLDESPGESPAISLPTPPPPPLMAALPPPPPPPPRRPPRRSVTFAESPPKSPRKSRFSPFVRRPSITMLDIAVPWTPASPRVWSGRPGDYKPEYIT